MNPISGYVEGIHSANELQDYILKTCAEHKKDGRAVAFAFIVYDFTNPAIRKVLKDIKYWEALDTISGSYLTVFYLNYNEDRGRSETSGHGHIGLMSAINLRQSFRPVAAESISRILRLEKNPSTPFVLFFQTEDNDISDSFVVSLKSDKVEDSFIELNQHIKNAVDSLSSVRPENYKNGAQVFNLIREGVVKNGKVLRFIKSNISTKISLTTLFQLIKYLSS